MGSFNPEDYVIWSDESLLMVNKPPGLLTLPDGYDPQVPYLRAVYEPIFGRLWTVHRLDRDTSGVILMARSSNAHRSLNSMFAERQIKKIYHALVSGAPTWAEKTVRLPLLPDGDRKHRTIVDGRRGKPAHTDLRVIERYRAYSLIEAHLHSGRRHQIRVHLASEDFPIVSDRLYGSGKGIYLSELKPGYQPAGSVEKPILGRLGLHAWSLALEHPITQQPLYFEAPYPKDFRSALQQCRKYGRFHGN